MPAFDARGHDDPIRHLLETIPHIVWWIDGRGERAYINTHGKERIGITDADIRGRAWVSLVHPADRQRVEAIWQAATQTASPYRAEYRLTQADGSYRWFLAQALPQRGASGEVEGWVGTWTDIDDGKRAEEALRQSEENLRQITDNIREVFWLMSLDTREMVYVSRAYEQMWGRSRDEVIGSSTAWLESVHPEDRQRVRAAAEQPPDRTAEEEYRIVRPDGTVRWIRDRAFPVRDRDGRLVRVAGVAEDVTERRQLREQLQRAGRMESIGLVAGGIAHDFRNLLMVINQSGRMLLEGVSSDDPRRPLVHAVLDASERGRSMVQQLLAFSRKQNLTPTVVDLNALVEESGRMIPQLIGPDIAMQLQLLPGPLRVSVDPALLHQALLNLVANARDAMPHGGTLTLATGTRVVDDPPAGEFDASPGEYVVLTVADTGLGMSKAVQSRVFEPFFTTKPEGSGTGLGLATAHGFVAQSGGFIDVESEEGAGTTFRLHLPRVS